MEHLSIELLAIGEALTVLPGIVVHICAHLSACGSGVVGHRRDEQRVTDKALIVQLLAPRATRGAAGHY